MEPESATVVIVGAGFSGLGMARRLQLAGIDDFVLLERGDEVGGTWRDNAYPGCACDVRSHLYSWSFAPNPDWTRRYARGPEIQAYVLRCVQEWGLRSKIRLGAELTRAAFDEETARWTLTCADGRTFVAPFQIAAVGALKDPLIPKVPGLETFAGPSMHSARWDPSIDLAGKRVAVIGTGASAVQIVPELAGVASQVTVFQRTPAWVFPRMDSEIPAWRRWLHRSVPGWSRLARAVEYITYESRYPIVFGRRPLLRSILERLGRLHIRREVSDPAVADALTPSYALGCKRILVSDDWYGAFNRDDVRLVPSAIDEVVPAGVRSGGELHEFDALVWCTGFTVDEPLGDMELVGVGGRTVAELWGGRPKGHLGITMPGFPNAFMLLGPNTALGHNSVIIMIEAQIRYVLQAIAWVRADPSRRWVDVRPEALDGFLAEIDSKHTDQVWMTGCRSWYLNEQGENFTIWPGSTLAYIWRTRRFDPGLHTSG
jgi:cation diffusion facilitator CzcD-associated flavoprotein CzcO